MSAISIPQYGRVPGTTRAQRPYPEEGTMTVTLEDRVEVLEGKVEQNLEVLTEFRREVNGKLDEFGRVQGKQAQTLDIHTGQLNGISKTVDGFRLELFAARNDRKELKNEVSGKLERLDNDVTRLQGDVTWLKGTVGKRDGLVIALSADVADLGENVTGLRTDVNGLKNDVNGLRNDVDGLRNDVDGLRNDVNELRKDVDGLSVKVDKLQVDVAGLKTELTEFKVEVRGTLAEILDRLPPKAA
jgi:chromosome segregation ATPase